MTVPDEPTAAAEPNEAARARVAPPDGSARPAGVTPEAAEAFRRAWAHLAPLGRADDGTYHRLAWTGVDLRLRAWFADELAARGLAVSEDAAGNVWGWWGSPSASTPGVATGSHLDSVPGGGAFDGPLGVVAALAAVNDLRARGVRPARPVGVVCFTDEEGGRFGVACIGSRVLTGAMAPSSALALRDADGVTLADALDAAGRDVLGPDPEALARVGAFVEVHVEQGRRQALTAEPLAVGTGIWPHGRWRVELVGQGNHAGTTPLADRDDPVLAMAGFVVAARAAAEAAGAVATVGRVSVTPNGTNVIASRATAWLDVRAPREDAVHAVLAALAGYGPVLESWTDETAFDPALCGLAAEAVADVTGATPSSSGTGAGHDAGILARAGVPAAMLFVRNPTGVSHAAGESASEEDCLLAVAALSRLLERLSS